MSGLSVDTLREIKECFVKYPQINKVLLYGSRAKGNYKSGSDIDISLIGKGLSLANTIYPLQEQLDELYLPYQFDISIFGQLDNPDLIAHILRVGKIFYKRPNVYPKHWGVKALGDACEVIAGQSPEGKYYNSEQNGLPFYQGKKEFTTKYIGEPTKWTSKVTKEANAGDILMSVRAPVGPVNFATQKICIGRGLAAIRTGKLIDKEFLYNFLVSCESEITGNTGAVFDSINKTQIENIQTPIPPLTKQKQITKKLDTCFAGINQAKTNLEQNLQNAKDLFQSTLTQIFTEQGNDWTVKTFGEVCEVIAGQSPEGKYYNSEQNGLPFYQGKKEFTTKYIGEPTKWTTKVTKEAETGDILMSVRAPVGPVNFATQNICIGRGLAAIRARGLIDKEFLYNFLVSMESQITGNTGAVFDSINKTQIENIEIPMPPLPEQKKIAKKLDKLNQQTQTLTNHYQNQLKSLEMLKQSLLEKAFSGEL